MSWYNLFSFCYLQFVYNSEDQQECGTFHCIVVYFLLFPLSLVHDIYRHSRHVVEETASKKAGEHLIICMRPSQFPVVSRHNALCSSQFPVVSRLNVPRPSQFPVVSRLNALCSSHFPVVSRHNVPRPSQLGKLESCNVCGTLWREATGSCDGRTTLWRENNIEYRP